MNFQTGSFVRITGKLLLLFLSLTSSALAQTQPDKSKPSPQPTPAKDNSNSERGEFVIAPIPISNPAVGAGLVFVGGYVFKLNREDTKSPPSVIGAVGAFTSNGSRGGGLGGRLYFGENTYQTTLECFSFRSTFARCRRWVKIHTRKERSH